IPDFLKSEKNLFRIIFGLDISKFISKNQIINSIIKNNYKVSGVTLTKIENNEEKILEQIVFPISKYDSFEIISKKFLNAEFFLINYLKENKEKIEQKELLFKPIYYDKTKELRYGENNHQSGKLYILESQNNSGLGNYEQLNGIDLSYNNILDVDACLNILNDFKNENTVCIIKHNNPCGLATGKNDFEALKFAWAGDEVSAFGSVIGFTKKVSLNSAKFLKDKFIEIIIAPAFEKQALDLLKTKKNLRILKINKFFDTQKEIIRTISGGFLEQTQDNKLYKYLKVVSKIKPKKINKNLISFGIKSVKHLKSNAISLVYEYKKGYYCIIGKGAGQPNRVDCYNKLARFDALNFLKKNIKFDKEKFFKKIFFFSDAFFPFPDTIEQALNDGIKYFIQPGGSIRDKDVIKKIDEKKGIMIFTGIRHFKH
ncbi:MAG TPA: hypothetical protein PK189_07210, partial [bacterium]|nr:hypothetical protein [bacterium]